MPEFRRSAYRSQQRNRAGRRSDQTQRGRHTQNDRHQIRKTL